MKSFNRWVRKRAKYFLAGIVVLLMVSWGISPMLQSRDPDPVIGKIAGKNVRKLELLGMVTRWCEVFANGRRQRDPVMQRHIWKQLVRVKAAERMGIKVTDAEIDKALSPQGPFYGVAQRVVGRMRPAALRKTIREYLLIVKLARFMSDSIHVTAREAWHAFAQQHERVKIRFAAIPADALKPLVKPTEKDLLAFYEKYKHTPAGHTPGAVGYLEPEKVQIEYILARTDDFAKNIKITDEQIKKYYEEHKNYEYVVREEEPKPKAKTDETKPSDESKSSPAGKSEAKTKPASPKPKTEEPKPTPKSEKTKSAYAPSVDGGGPDAAKKAAPPKTASAESSAKKPAEKTPENKSAAEKKAAQPSPKAEKKPTIKYRPLKEVRQEILEILRDKAADKKATELINKVDEQIGEAMHDEAEISFSAIAKKFGLVYKKTGFFSREEAEDVMPGAAELGKMLFQGEMFEKDPSRPMECLDGKFIFQILARRAPEPARFEDIKDKVREDYLRVHALRLARVRAEEGKKMVEAKGFDKGVAELEAKLEAELRKVGAWPRGDVKTAEKSKPDAKAKPAANASAKEKAGADKAKPKPIIRRGETDYFGRPQTFGDVTMCYIPELEGDRPNVGRVAFQLRPNQVGVAVEEAGEAACYIIQLIARKPADPEEFGRRKKEVMKQVLKEKRERLLKKWMEWLDKNAVLHMGQT